ncbi:MAG: dephospho-CoA kinase [Bacteroidetes bacterium]|nr:dephospho-CoA kinase [Bacteroidota bacterium]
MGAVKKIGVTGGIGSGKTTISTALESLYNIPIYSADDNAKRIMSTDENVKSKIIDLLGEESFLDNKLNRSYISSKVFNDKSLLTQLNNIVHKAVMSDFILWSDNFKNSPYVICEAAILIESGWDEFMDMVVVVEAPLDTRISRVIKRDNLTEQQVRSRIASQLSDEERRKKADYIVCSDGANDVNELAKQLNTAINTIIYQK